MYNITIRMKETLPLLNRNNNTGITIWLPLAFNIKGRRVTFVGIHFNYSLLILFICLETRRLHV